MRTRLALTGLLAAVAVVVGVFALGGDEPVEEPFTLPVPAGPDDDATVTLDAALFLPADARTYSHGMKQRLAIAQALLGRPELLVLDEPTDGLDPHQIRAMRELLAGLGERGHTVLVSSHLLTEVEQTCTHAVVIQAGRLLAAGRVDELTGATRTVVIETDDRARARTVLAGRLGADAVEGSGAGLAVHLGDHDTSQLVVWLVDAGLAVRAVTPRGRLEDAFLDLTGDGTAR